MRKLYHTILFILSVSLFYSCAAIQGTHRLVKIDTPNGEQVAIEGYDEFPFYNAETDKPKFKGFNELPIGAEKKTLDYRFGDPRVVGVVERSKDPLKVDITSPDTTHTVMVGHKPMFQTGLEEIRWHNGVPMTQTQRAKTIRKERNDILYRKGNWKLNVSAPFAQHFLWQPTIIQQRKSYFGFWGIKFGVEYYYKDNTAVELSLDYLFGYEIPILIDYGVYDQAGTHERSWQKNIRLTNSHKFGLFSVGYGLNLSRNMWSYYYIDNEALREQYAERGWEFPKPTHGTAPIKDAFWAVGPVLKTYVNLDPNVRMGLVYTPLIYSFGASNPWQYGHSITLDFKFSINLKKPQPAPKIKQNKP